MAISFSAPPATFSIRRACDGQSSGWVICSQVSPTLSSIERPMMSAMRRFTRVSRPSSDSSEMPSDAWPNIASSRAACRRASRFEVSRARANAVMSSGDAGEDGRLRELVAAPQPAGAGQRQVGVDRRAIARASDSSAGRNPPNHADRMMAASGAA